MNRLQRVTFQRYLNAYLRRSYFLKRKRFGTKAHIREEQDSPSNHFFHRTNILVYMSAVLSFLRNMTLGISAQAGLYKL